MKLLAAPEVFTSLYQEVPKVILYNIPHELRDSLQRALPNYSCIPLVNHEDGTLLLGESKAATFQPVSTPPSNVHFLWSTEPQTAWEELLEWWSQYGAQDNLPRIITGNKESLLRELLLLALKENAELLEEKHTLSRSLIQLRQQHERLRSAQGKLLDRFAYSGNQNAMEMLLSCKPLEESICIPLQNEQPLEQLLPTDGYGLACVDLYLEKAPSACVLVVELYSLECQRVLVEWQVLMHEAKSGWHQLWLPEALDERFTDVSLRLRRHPLMSSDISKCNLRLSACPQSRFSLSDNSERMLACRLWKGIPGVNYFAKGLVEGAGHTPGALAPSIRYALPDPALAQFTVAEDIKADFPHFSVRLGKVHLHPIKNVINNARLDSVLPVGTVAVSALASVDTEKVKAVVEACLVVAPKDASMDEILKGEKILADSGWEEVAIPFHKYLVEAVVPDGAYTDDASIFVLSRMKDNATTHCAWLNFTSFHITLQMSA